MALFRWSATHPISSPLSALLEQAGGCRCPDGQPADLQVFLPPHLLLEAGVEANVLADAYNGPTGSPPPTWLVNGERLLGLRPTAIAHWLQRQPPAEPMPLAPVPPLLAVVTLAQLEHAPTAADRYEQLEARSERGGAPADAPYRERLKPGADALLTDWRQITLARPASPADPDQLQALARDLELQIGLTLEAKDQAKTLQRNQRQLQLQLQRQQQTLLQLITLQSRAWAGKAPPFSR